MKISDLREQEYLELFQPVSIDRELSGFYTSDLLSDVMANAQAEAALVTIQAHVNTVAVCTLAGIRAIVICNNRPIPANMLSAAAKEDIAVFRTVGNQFDTSVRLAKLMD